MQLLVAKKRIKICASYMQRYFVLNFFALKFWKKKLNFFSIFTYMQNSNVNFENKSVFS